MLEDAISHHRQGRLDAAESLYEDILRTDPAHFDALQLLATLNAQRANFAVAADLFDRALAIRPDHAGSLNNRGIALLALRRYVDAIASFNRAIGIKPDFADALNNRGNALRALDRYDEALESYEVALRYEPGNATTLGNRGIALQSLRRNAEAVASYDRSLAIKQDNAEALNNRGVALQDLGRLDDALASFDRALALKPQYVEALNNRGNALRDQHRLDAAIDDFERALAVAPAHVSSLINCGNAWLDLKNADAALAYYERALAIEPANARALSNRGNALRALTRFDEALQSYDSALAISPGFAGAHNNRGNVLRELGRFGEAVASYDRAIALEPDFADAYNNRGLALRELGRDEEALASHDEAIRIKPDSAEAYLSRSVLLDYRGNRADALANCRKALEIKPAYADARWAMAMVNIPVMPGPEDDVAASRVEFARDLAALDAWFESTGTDGSEQVGTMTPFYLAYQEENNRDLLAPYGKLCAKVMQRWLGKRDIPTPSRPAGGTKRIGIVSAHFWNHSVWNAIVKGWFRHLDAGKFELHAFHLGVEQDAETAWAKSRSASFTQGHKALGDWVKAIADKQLDVLIYPEIGMNAMSIKLASLRLARTQAAAWGHPETTGLPTLDHYLSAAAFEPTGAGENYTENLVALPNLGCAYLPPAVEPIAPSLPELQPDADVPLLLSPGTPFKYAPQNDHVYVDIARGLGKCRIVFFDYKIRALSRRFKVRLESAFSRAGMKFDEHCVVVPWQNSAEFHGLLQRADVFLDTIGFSGFNTAMQAVERGLPIVTRQGRFMRGRLASGILQTMGLTEFIAGTNEAYVGLAVKLATDSGFRQDARNRIAASRHVLMDDLAPIRSLEAYLEAN
jgi:predicted O-linked N-acetylglucosamine transferase (SPINDLY family)